MPDEQPIWLAAGVRTPFVGVDGPFAQRDSLALSVPLVQAMAERAHGPIDLGVWGAVAVNLAYANLAREVWLEAKLDPHVPTFTTIMQCSTSPTLPTRGETRFFAESTRNSRVESKGHSRKSAVV